MGTKINMALGDQFRVKNISYMVYMRNSLIAPLHLQTLSQRPYQKASTSTLFSAPIHSQNLFLDLC